MARHTAREEKKPAAKRSRAGAIAALLALAAGGGGFWYWRQRPLPSPAERLARARARPEAKGRLPLANLFEDPRASAAQLAQAGALLLSAHADRAALELAGGFERRYPRSEDALLIEARAAIALRYGRRAEAALDQASRLAPADPRPAMARADLKTLQGDLTGALAAIEQASDHAPADSHLVVRRADLLVRMNRLDEAARITAAALESGFTPEVAAERAFVELQLGRSREAVALLRRALRADEKLAVAHYYLGAALYAQGDGEAAEREYREADRLDPDDSRALQALIELCTRSHRDEEAKRLRQELEARSAEAE